MACTASLAGRHTGPGSGERAPLAGRVSMDMLAVDVSGLREVHVGTPAVLWGPGLPGGGGGAPRRHDPPYELLCAVSQRVGLVVCGVSRSDWICCAAAGVSFTKNPIFTPAMTESRHCRSLMRQARRQAVA